MKPGSFEGLAGDVGMLKSIEMVDQNPIGKSQRSNPVTYTKAYDYIRKIFADQPYAVNNGMTPPYFFRSTGPAAGAKSVRVTVSWW